jgi:dienelactone hydrolase
MWSPQHADRPQPLVLLGHGGSGHKRGNRQLELARWFATEAGACSVAIDGPYHGDRALEPGADYQRRMAGDGIETVTDDMVGDWLAALDVVTGLHGVHGERVAYLGLSMGTRFGLPFVAAAGSRLRCSVLGKYGMQQPAGMPADIDMGPRFAEDAPRITVPVLYHVQWDDELFPRAGQLALFDLLGSPGRQLIGFPGKHAETSAVAVNAWREFVRRHVGD